LIDELGVACELCHTLKKFAVPDKQHSSLRQRTRRSERIEQIRATFDPSVTI
jgi:hypothetical protein